MPGIGNSSLICCTPISASPRATIEPTRTPSAGWISFGLHLIEDAEPLHHAFEMDAARALAVADRLGFQESVCGTRRAC